MGCVSTQVAHAYAEYFNQYGLIIDVHDSNTLGTRSLKCPVEVVPSKQIMRDLPPNSKRGSIRTGSQVFNAPEPDADDPHWEIQVKSSTIVGWEPHFVLREDWGSKDTFYESSSRLQKHMGHQHRHVNTETGRQDRNTLCLSIKIEEPYEFQRYSNYGSSSRAASRG